MNNIYANAYSITGSMDIWQKWITDREKRWVEWRYLQNQVLKFPGDVEWE